MSDLLDQDWFGWVVLVVIGLPLATIALTELNTRLARRGSAMTRAVYALRLFILPLGALLVLLTQIPNNVISNDGYWVKLTATLFGLSIIIFVLSSLNSVLFVNADRASWRSRVPSIFVDIVRLLLIGAGLAVLFSIVWGADVGSLFTALGVTSLVLGLALQNVVGSIVSGLLLLFEQPFQLGDWLKTAAGTGRVIEVNWRSIHLDVGSGIVIVPNASLAAGSFTNLSRPTSAHNEVVETTFVETDEPLQVIDVLNEVGNDLGMLTPGREASTARTGAGTYATSLPLQNMSDAGRAKSLFLTRLWYAARRRDLGLFGADIFKGESTADVLVELAKAARVLGIPTEQIPELAERMTIERYADGEIVHRVGSVPDAVRYLISGQVVMRGHLPDGSDVPLLHLQEGDYLGQSALSRTPTQATYAAATELRVLVIPLDVLDDLVRSNHRLARELGRQLEQRRNAMSEALQDLTRRGRQRSAPMASDVPAA